MLEIFHILIRNPLFISTYIIKVLRMKNSCATTNVFDDLSEACSLFYFIVFAFFLFKCSTETVNNNNFGSILSIFIGGLILGI